ncbi:MAG: hypothetical protein U0807_17630 [Candidatus Binatia bacterium]
MRAQRSVGERRHLRAEGALVQRGQPRDLGDQRVDLRAERAVGEPVTVARELRQQSRGDLVVDRVAQRLEVGAGGLQAHRHRPHLLDLAQVVAHEEATLQLVGEQEVARVVEVGRGEVALEEPHRRPGLVLRAGETAEGPELGELVGRVGLGEVLLEHVATDQIVMVRDVVPEIEVAREDVAEVDAFARQRLGPRRAEGGAEERVLAARTPDPAVGAAHGALRAVPADTEVLGVRTFELADAEGEVGPQILLLAHRQLGRPERPGGPRHRERHRHLHPDHRGPSAHSAPRSLRIPPPVRHDGHP